MLFCSIVCAIGKSSARHVSTQYKTSITNRKDLDGIQYHHGLGEGLFYGNQTTSKSFLAYDKTLIKQFHFYSGPSSTLRLSS